MILYNLPSGKAVWISLDTLLNLTDANIQDLEASNTGFSSNDPFLKLPRSSQEFKQTIEDDDIEFDDVSPDIQSDGDDDPFRDIDINNITDY